MTIKNKYHQELFDLLIKNSGDEKEFNKEKNKKYCGTTKIYLSIPNPVIRKIIRDWVKKNKDLNVDEFLNLLNSLFEGNYYDEISTAGKLLEYLPRLRKQIDPVCLDKWLNNVEGWAETDGLCQSNFTAREILADWNKWQPLLIKFSKNKNIHKRRASLVLLTKSVRESGDSRLADMSFANIDRLKTEKNILITKAVSWLLRSLIKNHSQKVKYYLDQNEASLPGIAIRETKNKLLTGKK